jgi:hypothetical protein
MAELAVIHRRSLEVLLGANAKVPLKVDIRINKKRSLAIIKWTCESLIKSDVTVSQLRKMIWLLLL